MFALFARLYLQFQPAALRGAAAAGGVPNGLFERAGARVGHNPFEAHQLREAAQAYLRVVR